MHARVLLLFRRFHPCHAGFSLVQLSVLLTIAGMTAAALIPGPEANDYLSRMKISHDRMAKIEQATQSYMTTYGHRPCPADATVDVGSQYFGREAANGGTCTGGTPAANFSGAGGSANIVAGGVPNVALGLPDDYAFDGFGHRVTYVVDKRATDKGSCAVLQGGETPVSTYYGDVEIRDAAAGTLISNTMWALISHGQDAHGAFPLQGQGTAGGYSVANRIQTGNTDTDTLKNASVDSSFVTAFTKTFVKKEKTATFDDLTWYAENTKNTCCVGNICTIYGFRTDGTSVNQRSGTQALKGDINGDGIKDLIVKDLSGVYVIFGSTSTYANPLALSSLDGTNGFKAYISGAGLYGYTGVGDINGDGIDDLAISQGIYVIVLFGKTSGWTATVDVSAAANINGTAGFAFYKGAESIGNMLMYVADVNGDSYADMIFDNYPLSRYYVIFGHANPWHSSASMAAGLDPSTLTDGTNGFYLVSRNAASTNTYPYLTAGDVTADGINDLLIRESGVNSVDVVFGHSGSWAGINGSTLGSLTGAQGANLTGTGAYFGMRMESADINGDGVKEFLLDVGGGSYGTVAGAGSLVIIPPANITWGSTSYDISAMVAGGTAYHIDGKQGVLYGFSNFTTGDYNNDGINDIAISCSYCTSDSPYGSVYVVFGRSGAHSNFNLATTALNGTNGFRIDCSYAQDLGSCGYYGMASLNINNDSFSDLVISSPNGTGGGGSQSGYTYVVYGKQTIGAVNPFALSEIQ